MEKKNSIYNIKRNSSIISGSPIADSTHLNRSNFTFPWGASSPTQKYLKLASPNKVNNGISIRATKMSPLNRKVIDPRVYTDVHSKGLTSRIVKYHDDSAKLSRSLSASSLYNKPGQFPIVHLNKSQIQYKANRNRPASVVRIAPPDKAVFQANTRSSILRSPSVVPTVNLRRTNLELSCENKPIIHPVDNDLMPTRSVLDALREISRKRINSDDLDGGNDAIKKYCKEAEDISRSINYSGGLSNTNVNNPSLKSTMKRQRESQQLSPNSHLLNSTTEQTIKKRMYTSNNDITSSLSSSIHMLNAKRKLGDIQSSAVSPTPSDNSISPKAKQPCNEDYNQRSQQQHQQQQLRDNELNLNVIQPSCVVVNQITPLPPTPNAEEHIRSLSKQQQTQSSQNTSDIPSTSTNAIPLSKSSEEKDQPKPKLTLFNKNYDDEEFKKKLDTRKILRESEEYGGNSMKFVKPRSNSSFGQLEKNPIIEQMKQSRLKLMLKGLKGELNENGNDKEDDENDEDETDISQKQSESKKEEAKAISAIPTTSASMSFATNTTISTSTITSAAVAVNPTKNTLVPKEQKELPSIVAKNDSTTGFSFGLKPNAATATVTTTTSNNVIPSPTTTVAAAVTTASSSGFSFGLNATQKFFSNNEAKTTTSTKGTAAVTATTTTSTSGFTFGVATTKTTTSANENSTSKNNVAFGVPIKPSSTENNSNLVPQFTKSGGFSFGENQQTTGFTMTQPKSAFTSPVSNTSISNEQKSIGTFAIATKPSNESKSFLQQQQQQQRTQGSISGSNSISTTTGTSNNIFGNFPSQSISGITTTSNQAPIFNFSGGSPSFNDQEKPKSTSGAFTLSSNSAFNSFSANPSTTSSSAISTTSSSIFGSNTTSPIFGNPVKPTFGTNSTETSTTSNSFGVKPTGGFTFSTTAKNTSGDKVVSSNTPFTFGQSPTSQSSGGFTFNTPTASTTAPTASFTSATTAAATPPQFSFNAGGNQFGTTSSLFPSSGNQLQSSSSNIGFNFGTPSKASDTNKPFNSITSNQNQTASNSTASSSTGFSFSGGSGINLTNNKPAPALFSFGAKPATTTASSGGFSFNNANPQNTFGNLAAATATNKNTTGGFSFSTSANTDNKVTTGFGTFSTPSKNTQQTQPSQLTTNKFTFSNLSNNKNGEAIPSATTGPSSSFVFSASGNNAQNSPFGGSSFGQTKSFNFSSGGTTSNTTNFFGGSSATTITPSTTSSSVFGSSVSQLGKPSSSSPFAFVAPANQQQQQPQQQQASNAPFTFGASSSSSLASNNVNPFAPPTNPNMNSKPLAFNFSAQGSSSINNTSTMDRPIKKATRRLNKNS